jgi:hypothetical protein
MYRADWRAASEGTLAFFTTEHTENCRRATEDYKYWG